MRLDVIRALSLATLLLGSSLGAAAEEASPETLAAGRAVFEAQCSRCHRSVDRVIRRVPAGTPEERAAFLDRVLPGHYAPEAETRAALIAHLLAE